MPKIDSASYPPKLLKVLAELGVNIRLARLRRRLTLRLVAERAGIGMNSMVSIEKGAPTVGIGSYAQVLLALGLLEDLLKVASEDVLGRKLQDAELVTKKRGAKRKQA